MLEPCIACGQSIAAEARICPQCRSSALVNLRLAGPIADGRVRYQVARSVAALGPPAPDLVVLQRVLQTTKPLVLTGATRALAGRALDALRGAGVPGFLEPARGAAGQWRGWVLDGLKAAALVVLLVAAGRYAWKSGEEPDKPAAAASQPMRASPLPARVFKAEDVSRAALQSTVALRCGNSTGAGFLVATDLVLTNAHVLCGSESVQVTFSDRRKATGDPIRSDLLLDLALVKVTGAEGPPLPLGDAGALQVGERVVMIGSPVGYDFTVHEGTVSSLSRSVLGVAYVQIDARVNPGNSGGPLVDAQGRVVGVVSLKEARAEGIGLVLPINYAYTGASAFIPPPTGQDQSEGFQEMVSHAREDERETVQGIELRPGVADAHQDQYGNLGVRIVFPSANPPGPLDASFDVVKDGKSVCKLQGTVSDWQPIDVKKNSGMDARILAWLDKNGFGTYLYLGEASLRCDLCNREDISGYTQLVMEGAHPQASRVNLNFQFAPSSRGRSRSRARPGHAW